MSSASNADLLLALLRVAMREWSAVVETEVAIEKLIGVKGISEVHDYVVDLAAEFIDSPHLLTREHVTGLLERFAASSAADTG